MPGIVYTGTKIETEWMCNRPNDFGFSATVALVEHDDTATNLDLSNRLQRDVVN